MKHLGKIILGLLLVGFIIYIGKGKEKNNKESSNDWEIKRAKNCDYNKFSVEAFKLGSNEKIAEKELKGCFVKEEFGVDQAEIYNEKSGVKVVYDYASNPNKIEYLDLIPGKGREATRYRVKKGHTIFKIEKEDAISFIYSDPISGTKGTIKISK